MDRKYASHLISSGTNLQQYLVSLLHVQMLSQNNFCILVRRTRKVVSSIGVKVSGHLNVAALSTSSKTLLNSPRHHPSTCTLQHPQTIIAHYVETTIELDVLFTDYLYMQFLFFTLVFLLSLVLSQNFICSSSIHATSLFAV